MALVRRLWRKIRSQKTLLETNLPLMRLMDISESGVDDNDIPYVRLASGEIFYSFLPTEAERTVYRKYRSYMPRNLSEDAFRVGLDLIQRFFRENSYGDTLPKSHHLYPGWGFVDLGAYLGFYTVKAARKLAKEGIVVAVEACPESYALLESNFLANNLDNVYPVHAAVCDRDGSLNLSTGRRQSCSIHASLRDLRGRGIIKYDEFTTVPARKLDSILAEVDYPVESTSTFVSFEINGAEPEALCGMARFLESSPRYDLRIVSLYGPQDGLRFKETVMKTVAGYPYVTTIDMGNVVYVHKYPVRA